MSATTIKQAAKTSTALDVIQSHKRDLALVLPSHVKPATWLSVAMGAVRKSDELWQACNETPSSMMVALMNSARLGLEPRNSTSSRAADDFPLQIDLDGLAVTVTNITGTTSPQTFTVDPSTVTQTRPAGSPITVITPPWGL